MLSANRIRSRLLAKGATARWGDHPSVRNLRQQGMILAFDVEGAAPDFAQRFCGCTRRGVLLRPIGNTVYFMPPYVVEAAQIDHMLDGADAALAAALD